MGQTAQVDTGHSYNKPPIKETLGAPPQGIFLSTLRTQCHTNSSASEEDKILPETQEASITLAPKLYAD